MSGGRLKAFIVTVRSDRSRAETFYILAKTMDQARTRAMDLARQTATAPNHMVAA